VEALRARDEELLGPGLRERPRPSLATAVAAGGATIVAVGVLALAVDLFVDDDGDTSRLGPTLLWLVVLAAGYALAWVLPAAVGPSATTLTAWSVLGTFGFLWLAETDSFDDIRVFLLCTILAYGALFVAPRTRGRAIYVALVALLAYFWAVAEVAGVDEAFSAAPLPTPRYSSPGALYDALRGGPEPAVVAAAARPAQVTLDDLDRSDPLYPLAQRCDGGDMEACDELYVESPLGSDFEEFGATCGGRESTGFDAFCDEGGGGFGDEDGGGFGDEFGDDLGGDFGDGFGGDLDFDEGFPLTPEPVLPDNPFTPGGDDKAAEVGIVSLLFAAAYLLAKRVSDSRGLFGLGTAFVLPGIVAAVTAAASLGDASGEAVVGGLLTIVAGFVVGLIGYVGRRRFSTWSGGAIASVGALVIAGDVSDTEALATEGDALSFGLVTIAFGIVVALLAFLIAGILESRGTSGGDQPPVPAPIGGGPDRPAAAGPEPTAPAAPGGVWTPPSTPPATAPPPAQPSPPGTSQWGAPRAPAGEPPGDPAGGAASDDDRPPERPQFEI
jgi:hypothetical protein